MINIYNANILDDLRTYDNDNLSAGDIVLLSVNKKKFRFQSIGIFRLKAGFAVSGKTDDATFILTSSIYPDMYWERVYKGRIVGEHSGITDLTAGGSGTVNHVSDPDTKRFVTYQKLIPQVITDPVTAGGSTLSPVGGSPSIRFPFYYGDYVNKITLNRKLTMTRVSSIDILADLVITQADPTGITCLDIFYTANGNLVLEWVYYISGTRYNHYTEYELSGTWTLRRNIGGYPANSTVKDLYTIGDDRATSWKTTSSGNVATGVSIAADGSVTLTDNIGENGEYYIYTWAYQLLSNDKIICSHAWFDIEGYWSMYQPNERDFHLHTPSGSSSWGDSTITPSVGTQGNATHYTFQKTPWLFAPESILALVSYLGESRGVTLLNEAGDWDYNIYSTPSTIPSSGSVTLYYGIRPGDDNVLCVGYPYDVYLTKFTNSGGAAVLGTSTRKYGLTDYSVIMVDFVSSSISKSCQGMLENKYAFMPSGIAKIDGVNNDLSYVGVTDSCEYDIDPGEVTELITTTDNKVALFNKTDQTLGIYTMAEAEYRSYSFRKLVITDSVGITSLSVSANIPALTDMRFLASGSVDGDLYKWNSGTSHWEVHTDPSTGNTLAEFNAANHTLLHSEVGSVIYVYCAMYSLDGTATPEFFSITPNYLRGVDFYAYPQPVSVPNYDEIDVIRTGDTTTQFSTQVGKTGYFNFSVFTLE